MTNCTNGGALMADNDRDTLTEFIADYVIHGHGNENVWSRGMADQILARWRLVPITPCELADNGVTCTNQEPEHTRLYH